MGKGGKSDKPATAGKKDKKKEKKPMDHVLLTNLPTDLKMIYSQIAHKMVPYVQSGVPDIQVQSGNATLMFKVKSKRDAEVLYKKLNGETVFGRRWAVNFHPAAAVASKPVPCAVDVILSAPLQQERVEAILASLPGFLAVTSGETNQQYVATFADEGSALHSRAVLSGREQEGAHVFLHRRPVGEEA